MNERRILMSMIRAARKALILHQSMVKAGYEDTPYFDLYGSVADSIYMIVGEDKASFEESVTHAVLNADSMTDAERVEALVSEHNRNRLYVDLTSTTRHILTREAVKRNIPNTDMANIVLSEWASNNDPYRYAFH